MTTITLHLPDQTPLERLHNLADSIDCDLRRMPDGTYSARPRSAQTNAHTVKMPHYRGQIRRATPRTEPDTD